MKKTVLYLALICLSTSTAYGAEVNPPCEEGWIPYEDEKCVRLFQTFAPREQAQGICREHGSTLVTITSEAEQQLLTQLILNSSDAVNVWIGAQRRPDSISEFVWNDGSTVQRFTNWAIGHPTDNVGRNCVQMRSQLSRQAFDMEWVDIACALPNWFICQKLQFWLPHDLQQAVLGLRREVRDSDYSLTNRIADLTHQLENATGELKNLQENPVPVGFIYVQLPNQPEPLELWPTVEWIEITTEYAGLFFRAAGEGSEAFGNIQAENSPRLSSVRGRLVLNAASASIAVTANNVASPTLSAGATGAANHWGLSFTVSSGEVRPRNTAMRIWMRTSQNELEN